MQSTSRSENTRTANPNEFRDTYIKPYCDYRQAFAYYLNRIVISPNSYLSFSLRDETIIFYAQVLHWFYNPSCDIMINVFKQLEAEIEEYLTKINHKSMHNLSDYKAYDTLEFKRYEESDLIWPLHKKEFLSPLDFKHCLYEVLIKKMQRVGLNANDRTDVYAIPFFVGVVPTHIGVKFLTKAIWFREFTTSPDGDTPRHSSWAHCLQAYIIISLIDQGVIKLSTNLSIKDLFTCAALPLKHPTPYLAVIFDVVFEQRRQAELLRAVIKQEKREVILRQPFLTRMINKVCDTPVQLKTSILDTSNLFSFYGITSPVFLSSYITTLQHYGLCNAPYLTILWTHKLAKLNLNAAKRNKLYNIDESSKRESAEIIYALNSSPFFFRNAPKANLKEIDLSLYITNHIDEKGNQGVFYKLKV